MGFRRFRRLGRKAAIVPLLVALALGCGPSGCADEEPGTDPRPADKRPPPKTPPAPPDLGEGVESPGGPVAKNRELPSVLRELRAYEQADYRPPTEPERKEYGDWLGAVLRAASAGRLPAIAAPHGFVGEWVDAGQVWLLRETAADKRGAGVVIVRPQFTVDVVIEVPHSYFDAGTLPIGLAAFQKMGARGLMVNTYHRGGKGSPAERTERALSGKSESDVAHQPGSFFMVAHEAWLALSPNTPVVQLHGFSDDASREADLIVSAAGTDSNIPPLAKELTRLLPGFVVKSYPDEIKVLGGTTNVQADRSRQKNAPFVHLEMSARLRERLVQDAPLLEAMFAALSRVRRGG